MDSSKTCLDIIENVLEKAQKCILELSSCLENHSLLCQITEIDTLETSVLQSESQIKAFFTQLNTLFPILEKFRPISEELKKLYENIDQTQKQIESLKQSEKRMEKEIQKTKQMLVKEEQSIQNGTSRPLWQYSTIMEHVPENDILHMISTNHNK